MTTTLIDSPLVNALRNLPSGAAEPIVESQFIELALLNTLGFNSGEFYRQFKTGKGAQAVDYALRKTIGDDVFLHTQSEPSILIEVKGRDIKLQENSPGYRNVVTQVKEYLSHPNCKTAQWGIVTNADHIQLFRKHGKVIHPATPCLEITLDNVDRIVTDIRHKIENPSQALVVAVYANKGGVGKTSTVINLAAVLGYAEKKKVLVLDFDPNQRDLTNSLGMSSTENGLFKVLTERATDIRSLIQPYTITRKGKSHYFFDVLPADQELIKVDDNELRKLFRPDQLREKLKIVSSEYDYILIDCSPNWTLFSQLSVIAADVILTPVGFNNLSALRNVAATAKEYIPEAQTLRDDGGPMQLPIFFNGGKLTDKSKATVELAIDKILVEAQSEGFDLRTIFYPKSTNTRKDRRIFEIPNFANIAGAVFAGIPASYQYKPINEQYRALAKEYFLQ
jgi:cellulose biosynthesis protein BcsQ